MASRFLARKYNRKIDYIVIFASVATGFELFESFYQMEDLISMIIRCVFATHIAMQIIMADFYYQKKTVFALLIPVLLHGFLDFAIDYGTAMMAMAGENEQAVLVGTGFLLAQVVISIVTIIMSMGVARRAGIEAEVSTKN